MTNKTYLDICWLRWEGNVTRMEESKSAFKIVTDKPTGIRLLGKPTRSWEDDFRSL
jgi:hypothetical protein